jgi:hypothetical protein
MGSETKEMTMKKLAIITAAVLVAASASGVYAQGMTGRDNARHHKAAPGVTTGSAIKHMGGDNAELKGNNGNSAGGSNSLANTNNPNGGMGNNAGPPMR